MKNIKKILFTIAIFLGTIQCVNAKGSVTISASSNYVTTGSQVTFYIKVNNAAAWSLSGYGVGSTSGCSLGDNGVGDSGTGENTSTTIATVTCKTTSVGQVGFVVTGNVSSTSGTNIEKTAINTSKSVTVQAPREKDTNNFLKSLNIKDYTLTPEFNKETLEYSVNVPSTVDKIELEGEQESGYATLSGTGEYEVNEGINTFEITVTSETGVDRVYKITVNVADENPIEINIANSKYTIMKNAKTLETPVTYEPTTIKIKEFDIPAFYSDKTKLTLIGVKDSKGTSHFVIYDKDKNTYELYNENKSSQFLLFIKDVQEEKERFTKEKVVINNISYDALVFNDDKNIIVIYAMNIETGKEDYYLYDKEDGSFIKYNESLLKNDDLKEELKKYKDTTIYFVGAIGVLLFIILILILVRPKRKKEKKKKEDIKIEKIEAKKDKKNKEEQKQEDKQQNSKEEALKQVSEVASIIEEYEKTMKLNKKELEEQKQEIENKEETMFDIFESDKKHHKK